jgi:transposase-like protein/IS1 family transposase
MAKAPSQGKLRTVIAIVCQHERRRTNGTTKAGATRYRCKDCGKTWTESTDTFAGMRIGMDRAVQIIELLCEGMTVRGVERITGVAKHTILDLLKLVGERCEDWMTQQIKGVHASEVQVDEIWQYIYCKAATAKREKIVGGCGDSYTFTAIERHSKLLVAWHMGRRTEEHTSLFIAKLARATDGHFHVSSDGWRSYPQAIKRQLGHRVDHGVMQKIYGTNVNATGTYSPARIIGSWKQAMHGQLYQEDMICTSHVERMNGSIRHFTKRMGRLTYAFSKRWSNHRCALAIFFAHYNWCRKHKSLKTNTPAMAHGLADKAWSVRELLAAVLHT